ncbi:lanthionine synthetase LanC family protein [Actinokineospora sp. HUAS TT18]|uniref:lanthionine synthetase LanC family protein n=1 Tax=Actinokineospora sp. HUAS TT18 TaxID=3447451 RepID=UPI003F521521
MAAEVAARAVDPDRIAAGVAALGAHSAFPDVLRWRPGSLALGDAGAAALCAVFDQADPSAGWDRTGHHHLAAAVSAMDDPALPLSLFAGASGIAAAASLLSRGGQRYSTLRAGLDAVLLPGVIRSAAAARGQDQPDFDLIAGMAGWTAALLLRPDFEPARAALAAVGTAMVDIADYPEPGLAHGAAGPLAALALLHIHAAGLVPGVPAAIRALGARVAEAEVATQTWCTGSLGISRALWLAGTALPDTGFRAAAVDLAVDRPEPVHRSPTLCHGTAGALLVAALFWWDTGDQRFREQAVGLGERLLEAHRPDSVFGFHDVESTGIAVDNPGVLVGSAGVAMVLLAVAGCRPPGWTRLFLLS